MNRINIAIVEDQELFYKSLKIIIDNKPDMKVVGIAEKSEQIFEIIKAQDVDIILMDIRLPGMNGVQCTKIVKERYPNIKIIVLTTFEDDEYVFDALKYGASGYLLKGIKTNELIEAIRITYEGGALINPNIAVKIFNYFSKMAIGTSYNSIDKEMIQKLSQNEQSILQLLGAGLSNKEIAKKNKLVRRNDQKLY